VGHLSNIYANQQSRNQEAILSKQQTKGEDKKMRKICKKLIFYGIMLGILTHFVTNARGNMLDVKAHEYLDMFKTSYPVAKENISTLASSEESLPLQYYSKPWNLLFWAEYALSEMRAYATMSENKLEDSCGLLDKVAEVEKMLARLKKCSNMLLLRKWATKMKKSEHHVSQLFESDNDLFGLPRSVVLCQRSWSSCVLHSLFNCLRIMLPSPKDFMAQLAEAESLPSGGAEAKSEHLNRVTAIFRELLPLEDHALEDPQAELHNRVEVVLDWIDGGFDVEGRPKTASSLFDTMLAFDGRERICGFLQIETASQTPRGGFSLSAISPIMAFWGLGLKNVHVPKIVISGDGSDVDTDMIELSTAWESLNLSPGGYIVEFTPRSHAAFLFINEKRIPYFYNSDDTRIFDEEYALALSGDAVLKGMLKLTTPTRDGDTPWDEFETSVHMIKVDEERSIRFNRVIDQEEVKAEAAARQIKEDAESAARDAKSAAELAEIYAKIDAESAARDAKSAAELAEIYAKIDAESAAELAKIEAESAGKMAELEAESAERLAVLDAKASAARKEAEALLREMSGKPL
jgi:hypothetical protein